MSRRRKLRRLLPVHHETGNIVLAKLVNCLMSDGKKSVASKLVSKALEYIELKLEVSPIKVLYEALDNITPYVEVRTKKVGGVSYRVPVDVPSERRLSLSLKWLVEGARLRREAGMWLRLAWEIIDSVLRRSSAYKKKQTVCELVCANQAFSHLGW